MAPRKKTTTTTPAQTPTNAAGVPLFGQPGARTGASSTTLPTTVPLAENTAPMTTVASAAPVGTAGTTTTTRTPTTLGTPPVTGNADDSSGGALTPEQSDAANAGAGGTTSLSYEQQFAYGSVGALALTTPVRFDEQGVPGSIAGNLPQSYRSPLQQNGVSYTRTISQVIDALRTSNDPTAISTMQHELYDAGFYDDTYYKTPTKGDAKPTPVWGKLDIADLDALQNGMDFSILRHSSFQKGLLDHTVTHQATLAAQKKAEQDDAKRQAAAAAPPNVNFVGASNVTVPDPDSIATVADTIAQNLLGRELSNEERTAVVGSVMGQATAYAQNQGALSQANAMGEAQASATNYANQTAAQEAYNAGTSAQFTGLGGALAGASPSGAGATYIQGGGVNVSQEVSPESRAQSEIEQRYSEEAKKYARTKQVNVLLKMISNAAGSN